MSSKAEDEASEAMKQVAKEAQGKSHRSWKN